MASNRQRQGGGSSDEQPVWKESHRSSFHYEDLPPTTRAEVETRNRTWCFVKDFVQANPGRQLQVIRVLQGYSQERLAEEAGVRQCDVSRAERDFRNTRAEIIGKIADKLGVEMNELLFNPAGLLRGNAELEGLEEALQADDASGTDGCDGENGQD